MSADGAVMMSGKGTMCKAHLWCCEYQSKREVVSLRMDHLVGVCIKSDYMFASMSLPTEMRLRMVVGT